MKKAVIYLRTSSDRQIDNTSLDTQENLSRGYCERESLEVIDVKRCEAVSAKETNIKRIAELLEYAKENKGKFEILVVWKLDRFARDTQQHLWLRSELLKHGIVLRSATEKIDESPQGRFLETILAAVAQLDNDVRKERVKIALWRRVEEGNYPWTPPTGYYRPPASSNGLPVPIFDPGCKDAAIEVFKLYSTGVYTLNMISRIMSKKKLKNHKGKTIKFPNQLVDKMLKSVFYIGYLKHQDGRLIKAQHEPLIDVPLWEKCQQVRNKQSHNIIHKRNFYSPDFVLRRFTICGYCSKPLTACWSQGRTEKYPYYYCKNKDCEKYGKMIARDTYTPKKPASAKPIEGLHDAFYEYLKLIKPKDKWVEAFHEVFIVRYEERKQELQGEYMRKIDIIKQLEDELDWVVTQGRKGNLSETIVKKQSAEVEQKMTLAQMDLKETHSEKIEIETLLNHAYVFIRTPHLAWYDALPEAKIKYQRLIFPKGVIYQFDSLSNQELGLPFKLIAEVGQKLSTNVGRDRVELSTSSLSEKRSTAELTTLQNLESKIQNSEYHHAKF